MPNSIFNTIDTTMASIGGGGGGAEFSVNGGGAVGSGIYTTNGTVASPQYVFANSASTAWSNNVTSTGPVIAPDFIMDGVSLKDTFEKINERLAILVPDPAKLEKFAALKAAYEHYKLLEKLCTEP